MSGTKRWPAERGYQKCAFEIYCAMGDERSHAAVAEKSGMSISTIKRWAQKFDWRERLNHRIAWQAEDKPEQTADAQSEEVERGIRFLDAALARMITHLAKGNLRASPQDLMTLHRLEQQISERTDKREETEPLFAYMPHNNRGVPPGRRVIPESQLNEYMDYLKYRI